MVDSDQAFPHRLLITSRALAEDDVSRLGSAVGATYSLEPFDEDALCLFAQRWFARDGRAVDENLAEQFLSQVRKARLTEIVTVPLLATVAAIVFEKGPESCFPLTVINSTRNTLATCLAAVTRPSLSNGHG